MLKYLQLHWIIVTSAVIGILLGVVRWFRLYIEGVQDAGTSVLAGFAIAVGFWALLRADRALKEPGISLKEAGLLILAASLGWYVVLAIFPTMMIGQGPQIVPAWYFWLAPAALTVYAALRQLRHKRGAAVEW